MGVLNVQRCKKILFLLLYSLSKPNTNAHDDIQLLTPVSNTLSQSFA